MPRLDSVEKFPKFKTAVQSIYSELGENFNKHANIENLSRHVSKNDRQFVRHLVTLFIKTGFLRKHRTDTFAWTNSGLKYAKKVLFE